MTALVGATKSTSPVVSAAQAFHGQNAGEMREIRDSCNRQVTTNLAPNAECGMTNAECGVM
jgi:hypothetical protein